MASSYTTQIILTLIVSFVTTIAAVNFNCSATGENATCRALVGYQPFNDTTYANVQALFQVPALSALLGANNEPTSTAGDTKINGNNTVLVPIPCRCVNGSGRSDQTPHYTSQPGDTLFNVATLTFGHLVTFGEIATYNNLADANKINPSNTFWIPLPCSCDASDGFPSVHLAHRVVANTSIPSIAQEFGVNSSTLLSVNGIVNPNTLQADQIIDVPLRACSSSINSSSVDYGLRLANNSYDFTANNCVFCSCNADTFTLNCYQTGNSSRCSVPNCSGNLALGNFSTSGCDRTTCSYTGYTNTSSTINVLVATTNQTTCTSGVPSLLEFRGSKWMALIIILQMTWLYLL